MAEYIEKEKAIVAVDDALVSWKSWFDALDSIQPADVRPVRHGTWKQIGKSMMINLDNARKQYRELGYPHRTQLALLCSLCQMTTLVDASISYSFCPHCGAFMRGEQSG